MSTHREEKTAQAPKPVGQMTRPDLEAEVTRLRESNERLWMMLDPKILALNIENGSFEMLIDGRGMSVIMAEAFWGLLTETEAENYVTLTVGRGDRELEVIVQKRAKKTANDLQREAEAERDRLKAFVRRVADFCKESKIKVSVRSLATMAAGILESETSR